MEKIKKKTDFLSGSLWDKILAFSIPVALTSILEQLFNASDIAVVGNFTGELKNVAVAAVGANSPIIGLVVNFFIGFALGSNVVISKAIGEKNEVSARNAVHTSVLLAVVSGLVMTVLGEIFAPNVLSLLNVPDDVYPYALEYLRIYFVGLPVILLYNFEAAIFRSVGQTKMPLIALAASGGVNVILNLFFVIVLKMNVSGVAVATVISNALSSLFLLVKLLKTDDAIKVTPKNLKFYGKSLKEIIKIGLPSGVQGAVFAVSNIVIQSAINTLGSTVMAASSAAYNVEIFAYYIFNSFSQACTTFTGQNYGAKKYERCRKTYFVSLLEDVIATVTVVSIILLSGKFLLAIFNADKVVVDTGYDRLLFIVSSYVFSMIYEVTAGYLRGYGISLTPAILTTIGVCVVRIIWIATVFPVYGTFRSILAAYPISLSLTAIMMVITAIIIHPSARKIAQSKKQNATDEATEKEVA